jgi:hypothetical protein
MVVMARRKKKDRIAGNGAFMSPEELIENEILSIDGLIDDGIVVRTDPVHLKLWTSSNETAAVLAIAA